MIHLQVLKIWGNLYTTKKKVINLVVEDIKEGIMIVKNQFPFYEGQKGGKNNFDKFITSMIELWKLQKMKTYYF